MKITNLKEISILMKYASEEEVVEVLKNSINGYEEAKITGQTKEVIDEKKKDIIGACIMMQSKFMNENRTIEEIVKTHSEIDDIVNLKKRMNGN